MISQTPDWSIVTLGVSTSFRKVVLLLYSFPTSWPVCQISGCSCTQGSKFIFQRKSKVLKYFPNTDHHFPLSFPFLSFSCVQYRTTETAPRIMLIDITWTSAPNTHLGSTALPLGAIHPVLIGRDNPFSPSTCYFSLRGRAIPMNGPPCLRILIFYACYLKATL